MNVHLAQGEGAPVAAADLRAELRRLEESVPHLRQTSDLAGLALVRQEAETLAAKAIGRGRRKAERIAEKASHAVEDLRRNGAETPEERQIREKREADQARWDGQKRHAKLLERLVSLLHMLLTDGKPPAEGVAVLRGLAMTDDEGYLRIEIPAVFAAASPILLDGYEQSRQIFGKVDAKPLKKEWPSVEHTLKRVAVELMTAGAEVRGLKADVVPLVAYSLFSGNLSNPADNSFSAASEQVDDLLLSIADEVAAMPMNNRPLFIGLFRSVVLLGEAQAYAEKLSLTTLTFA